MKHILTILFFHLASLTAVAQITFAGTLVPSVGDTFIMATDHLPMKISMGEKGASQNWDFTSLQSAFAVRAFILPADPQRMEGKHKVDAIARLTSGVDQFLRINGNKIYEVGRSIKNPFSKDGFLEGYYTEIMDWFQPIKFLQENEESTSLIVPVDVERLSFSGEYSWARKGQQARIVCAIQRSWMADAWGRLRIPFGVYDVVRQHIYEDVVYTLEVLNKEGQWEVLNGNLVGAELPELRLEKFVYWSDDLPHPVAIVDIHAGTGLPEKVHYKAFEFRAKVVNKISSRADAIAYPNPAFDIVRFDFANLDPGNYTIELFDILGRQVESFEVGVSGYTTVEINLSFLKKGTYIYRVSNQRSNSITSKRLVIIQP